MSSQTPNLNLVLPVGTEKVSRQIINDNNTKIDTAVGANSTAIANMHFAEQAATNISTSNVDSFTTNGIYNAYLESPLVNSSGWGQLFVVNTSSVISQTIITDNTLKSRRYTKSLQTWSSWQEYAKKSEVPQIQCASINNGYRFTLSVPNDNTTFLQIDLLESGGSAGRMFVTAKVNNVVVYNKYFQGS